MRRILLVLLVILAVLAGAGLWLFYFVGNGEPYPADAIVVLSGNPGRPAKGVELQREGVAPELVLSVIPPLSKKLAEAVQQGTHRHLLPRQAGEHRGRGANVRSAREAARLGQRRDRLVALPPSPRTLLFARCTDAKLQVAAADTTLSEYARNVPLEVGKFLDQLTLNRDC